MAGLLWWKTSIPSERWTPTLLTTGSDTRNRDCVRTASHHPLERWMRCSSHTMQSHSAACNINCKSGNIHSRSLLSCHCSSINMLCFILLTVDSEWHKVITFCMSRRRRKMYCGHTRLCVCLSVCPRPYAHTTARTRM